MNYIAGDCGRVAETYLQNEWWRMREDAGRCRKMREDEGGCYKLIEDVRRKNGVFWS